MPFDKTIERLDYILQISLNGQKLCKKEILCLESFGIKKENIGSKKSKTKNVLEKSSKLFLCLKRSSLYNCVLKRLISYYFLL